MTRAHAYAFFGLLVLSLTFAACQKHDAGASAAEPPALAAASQPAAGDAAASPGLSVLDRKVIKTGSLTVTVENSTLALEGARGIAERHGGHVLSSGSAAPSRADEDGVTVNVSLS